MYPVVLGLHNVIRWIVLLFGVFAVIRAFVGWFGQKEWTGLDNQLSLGFTISMDVQVLLGLLLYVVLSPITTTAFSDFGAAMADSDARFWLVEHITMMLIALALAHVGRSRAKKAETAVSKYKQTAIFFALSLLAVLAAIPWYRPFLPF